MTELPQIDIHINEYEDGRQLCFGFDDDDVNIMYPDPSEEEWERVEVMVASLFAHTYFALCDRVWGNEMIGEKVGPIEIKPKPGVPSYLHPDDISATVHHDIYCGLYVENGKPERDDEIVEFVMATLAETMETCAIRR
jgi:hypothetical protein